MRFGARFPAALGGGEHRVRKLHRAILKALESVLDTSEGTEFWCEAYGEAVGLSILWACNKRLANQLNPRKMIDALEDWESACGLYPTLSDSEQERRARLAAKLRGLSGNTFGDIYDAMVECLGANVTAVRVPAEAEAITYWPGVNPGPPGYEWSTSRVLVTVQMNEDGLAQSTFEAKRDAAIAILNTILPAWMSFCVGVGDGFILGVGILGKTLL